jgi:hypothetical protein
MERFTHAALPQVVGDRPPVPLPRKAAPMSHLIRRPPRGRLRRLRTLRPRSRRAAVPLGLVLAVGGAAGVALADIVAPASGGRLTAVSPAVASTGVPRRAADEVTTGDGLHVERVIYTREDKAGGVLDVFASAAGGPRAIVVSGEGFRAKRLTGDHGRYQARVRYDGEQAPLSVRIADPADVAGTERTVEVDDRVYATAVYDVDARRLMVRASSSDTLGRPRLSARGFGVIAPGGVLVADTNGTPANVTVASAAGGSVTVPVSLTGAP